jgi:hypothetical protein
MYGIPRFRAGYFDGGALFATGGMFMSRFRWIASIWILTLCAVASQALGQTVSFVDETGAAAPSYVEGTRAFVRVEDPSANVSPVPDTVQVRLTSTRGGDEEFLSLSETGPGTGVFRGAIPLAPSGSSAQPGVLETAVDFNPPYERDTIRAEYGAASATATMVGSRLQFLDPYGRPTAQVILGGLIQVRLTAPLVDTSPQYQDAAMVVLTTGNGDQETIYINEKRHARDLSGRPDRHGDFHRCRRSDHLAGAGHLEWEPPRAGRRGGPAGRLHPRIEPGLRRGDDPGQHFRERPGLGPGEGDRRSLGRFGSVLLAGDDRGFRRFPGLDRDEPWTGDAGG